MLADKFGSAGTCAEAEKFNSISRFIKGKKIHYQRIGAASSTELDEVSLLFGDELHRSAPTRLPNEHPEFVGEHCLAVEVFQWIGS